MSIGKIGEFHTKNGAWTLYADRLEMYFKANNIAPELQLPTLISIMGEESYELLVNLASPRKPSELTYSEASEMLRHHLQPTPSILAERYRFRQRRQASTESISDYVAELKKLARNCKFNDSLGEILRDEFVCGLKSDVIRQRLFAEDDGINFNGALKIANSLEAAERDAAAVEARSVPEAAEQPAAAVHAVQQAPRRGHGRRSMPVGGRTMPAGGRNMPDGAGSMPAGGRQCKGCGDTGHGYGNCMYREYVCSRCKRVGHLRRACAAWTAPAPTGGLYRRTGDRGMHHGAVEPQTEGRTEQHYEDNDIDLHQLCLGDYMAV